MTTKKYMVKCQHEGCTSDSVSEWSIGGYEPEPVFFFCHEHAAEFGFCLDCGSYIGGTEDVFLTGRTGICFQCYEREQRELDRVFEGEDWDDDESDGA